MSPAHVVGPSPAVRASTRARHYGRHHRPLIIRPAAWTDPLVTFRENPLDDGLAFYAFVTAGGAVLDCGIGDDRDEALLELYGSLTA